MTEFPATIHAKEPGPRFPWWAQSPSARWTLEMDCGAELDAWRSARQHRLNLPIYLRELFRGELEAAYQTLKRAFDAARLAQPAKDNRRKPGTRRITRFALLAS